MIVFRVARSRHSGDLSGEGARLHGGRWNHRNVPCIYCSASRALAVLEFSVNVSLEDITGSLTITCIDVPENGIRKISIRELPPNWKDAPAPASTRDFGTKLLTGGSSAIFRIPSVVIPEEFNYILNPLHPEARKFKVLKVEDFVFDSRIKRE